jgi:hypothetical protein
MTTQTMRLRRPTSRDRISAQEVFPLRYRLEVSRVNAPTVPAEVIHLQIRLYLFTEQLV